MALTAPTGLTITRLRAVGEDGFSVAGSYFPGPKEIRIYGLVEWTNSESADHTVELVTGCSESCHVSTWNEKTILEKGANSADVLLAKFHSSVAQGSQPADVSVQLRGASGDSATISTTITVDFSSIATPMFTGNLKIDEKNIQLPVWAGVLWKPTLVIMDAYGTPVANYSLSRLSSGAVTLPPGLVAGKSYKAVLEGRPDFERKIDYASDGPHSYYQILPSSLGVQSLVFSLPEATYGFSVGSKSVTGVKNQPIRIPISRTHPAVFEIVSGAPAGFTLDNPDDSVPRPAMLNSGPALVGTPVAVGVSNIVIKGTRISDAAEATGTIALAVVSDSSVNRVEIVVNPGWLNNGLAYAVGDRVSVQLASTPSGLVDWTATGLPTGLTIDPATGLISGTVTAEGRFIANITAAPRPPLEFIHESLPVQITFTIRAATPGGGGGGSGGGTTANPAITRMPWLLSEWTLTDLQVFARSREVQSTLIDKTGIPLKIGDNVNFAVFFVGADNRAFDLDADKLRITIRPADNVGDPLVFESDASPEVVTTAPDPYYLISSLTGARERETVQDWVESSGKNEALACIADVEWTKEEQVFSSKTFAVLMELDVARP